MEKYYNKRNFYIKNYSKFEYENILAKYSHRARLSKEEYARSSGESFNGNRYQSRN